MAWIKPTGWGGGGFGRIVDKSTGTDGQTGYSLQIDNSNTTSGFQMEIDGSTFQFYTTPNSVQLNQWQHVAWSFDGTTHNVYINGILNTKLTSTKLPPNTNGNVYIGNRANNTDRGFAGLIDDARIYNYVLTPQQIQTAMNDDASMRIAQ